MKIAEIMFAFLLIKGITQYEILVTKAYREVQLIRYSVLSVSHLMITLLGRFEAYTHIFHCITAYQLTLLTQLTKIKY